MPLGVTGLVPQATRGPKPLCTAEQPQNPNATQARLKARTPTWPLPQWALCSCEGSQTDQSMVFGLTKISVQDSVQDSFLGRRDLVLWFEDLRFRSVLWD